MSSFSHVVALAVGGEKVTNTTKKHPLGIVGEDVFGGRYHYAFSQAAIGAGQVVMQSVGVAANDMDLAVQAAAAVGAQSVSITTGATASVANEYADGILYVNDVDGEGHRYRILNHLADAGSTTMVINLYPNDKIKEALTTSSEVGLMKNPFMDAEIWDANDIDGAYLGVAPTEVADNAYFWVQDQGEAAVLADGTTMVLGKSVEPSDSVDGAATNQDTSAATDHPAIGICINIPAASGDYGMVRLG